MNADKRLLCSFVLMLLILALGTQRQPLNAQEAGSATRRVTEDEVNAVARQLYCPLCSGVRLDTCELKACDQMRQEIALKLEEGKDVESIKADFLTQYGPQVLGEPPRQGFNWLAWLLPVAVLAAGAIFLVIRGRSLFIHPATSPALPNPAPGQEDERLVQQLNEELKRYG
jgi:cytochrome c-type biogenesis protein CcmH